MKVSKKHLTNIVFVLVIGLMIYPPTKVYFIRLFSFAPSINNIENQEKVILENWQLRGLNTENINYNNIDDQVIFVNFWATWCPPCIAEMPSMNNLYKDYKEKVTFLFVTNENWETVSQFYKKKGYKFPTYNQITNSPEKLKSSTIPATFILSKSKKIIVDKKGAANWNSETTRSLLDNLLKE